MNKIKLEKLFKTFFMEDIGEGDLTNLSVFDGSEQASGIFLIKEEGTIAGLELIYEGYRLLDPSVTVTYMKKDGDLVKPGEAAAEVRGNTAALLSGERVILNLLQRMSGVATTTRAAVESLGNNSIKVTDTRKTTPGLRMLEKYAVRCGGGINHRLGLYDAVMLKDNHIAAAGGISEAVDRVRKKIGHTVKIEVETESADQVKEAVQAGADIIMFDNCSPQEAAEWRNLVPRHIVTEVSGGITLDNIADYRNTGIDAISLGMLTHSFKALDISFDIS
ncbi:carboxylating nicotinate-nucleotide diphosphorylase [Bacillus marinisedimentorum]|uniref:carboxylating nicotinate-nucleotide diphosphorylase n=1 Tax=Bacillus marinisedimentorum TaxID=1821260 RepID=UPI0008731484|nr:carboxylating nicotinate-nucleotide diphosphorylase [Bacillus marinisedimentorum]